MKLQLYQVQFSINEEGTDYDLTVANSNAQAEANIIQRYRDAFDDQDLDVAIDHSNLIADCDGYEIDIKHNGKSFINHSP